MDVDFPFARSVVVVRSRRTIQRTRQTTEETRYYVTSLDPDELTNAQWHQLIRGYWAGVENRNHWRRDALFGEDRSRSRKTPIAHQPRAHTQCAATRPAAGIPGRFGARHPGAAPVESHACLQRPRQMTPSKDKTLMPPLLPTRLALTCQSEDDCVCALVSGIVQLTSNQTATDERSEACRHGAGLPDNQFDRSP